MSLTLAQARDDILTVFKTAWDTTSYPAMYDDVDGDDIPTDTSSPWARITVKHDKGQQTALCGADGSKRFTRTGVIIIQIFTPSGEGLSSSDTSVKIIQDAFEGKKSTNGVWFRDVDYKEIGPSGDYYQVNVIIQFEYDEIK